MTSLIQNSIANENIVLGSITKSKLRERKRPRRWKKAFFNGIEFLFDLFFVPGDLIREVGPQHPPERREAWEISLVQMNLPPKIF